MKKQPNGKNVRSARVLYPHIGKFTINAGLKLLGMNKMKVIKGDLILTKDTTNGSATNPIKRGSVKCFRCQSVVGVKVI